MPKKITVPKVIPFVTFGTLKQLFFFIFDLFNPLDKSNSSARTHFKYLTDKWFKYFLIFKFSNMFFCPIFICFNVT